jgi:hypothetical protein
MDTSSQTFKDLYWGRAFATQLLIYPVKEGLVLFTAISIVEVETRKVKYCILLDLRVLISYNRSIVIHEGFL